MTDTVRFRRAVSIADMERGEWATVSLGQPFIRCPLCGVKAELHANHKIAADGTVTASVQCPRAPCAFHAHAILEGWRDAP